MIEREEIGRKVMEAAQACAEGYRRGITSFSTEVEKEINEKCAIAASNTGWFILESFGFSNEEKKALYDGHQRS